MFKNWRKLASSFVWNVIERYPFITPRTQLALTPVELEIARSVQQQIRSMMQSRDAAARQQLLNASVDLPNGIWDANSPSLYDGFQTVLNGGADVLNHLRLFCQHFTGYRVLSMEYARGCEYPKGVPADLEQQLRSLATTPHPPVRIFRRLLRQIPDAYAVRPPHRMGEIGWDVAGHLVTYDTLAYQERMQLLHESGALARLSRRAARGQPVRILEIGGGFGGLACHIKQQIPAAQYYIVDLPESLLFSGIYLSVLYADEQRQLIADDDTCFLAGDQPGVCFVPNFQFDALVKSGLRFDLAINTLSMSEMGEAQVRDYCAGLGTLLNSEGQFFEQNQDNRCEGHLDARMLIADYFQAQRNLSSAVLPHLSQGCPHLWSVPKPAKTELSLQRSPDVRAKAA